LAGLFGRGCFSHGGVFFCGFVGVSLGRRQVTVCRMGMVSSFFVFTGLHVLVGLVMMQGCCLVVGCGYFVMTSFHVFVWFILVYSSNAYCFSINLNAL
jgi:hypothetical protein